TFKEDVPDLRNTRVIDIVREIEDYGVTVQVHDPMAESEEAREEYDIELCPHEQLQPADCVILAVAHDDYVKSGWDYVKARLRDGRGPIVDVKGVLDRSAKPRDVTLWRL
ncbi:MAG: UDP binding domain-containing protein, partial [Gammaproteobacteria bacterium]